MMRWQKRLRALRVRLQAEHLDALVVTHLPNLQYLVNFRGSAGCLVVTPRQAVLFTDGRYQAQARREVRSADVGIVRGVLLSAAGEWLASHGCRRVGFEATRITFAGHQHLRRACRKGTAFVPTSDFVEALRAVKEAQEISAIRQAVQLASRVFSEILPLVRPGVRELDLAAEIDYRMRRRGARGPAFETIVASGARSAWPHARASGKRLARNELVVFDLGAILSDYCSDMTRTVYLGNPPARVRRLYAAVREAQQQAFETLRAGIPAGAVDTAVRQTLKRHRLDSHFVHSTGHGVGLEIHERPSLRQGDATPLQVGQVVTLEPGVYLAGFGGIRIEDVVVVRRNGAERLTPTPHALIAL